ncbi:hypothetical protein AVEN_20941-1 [Araneus ventricosus]|uniref:Uncharacterized protein n=1 Tax=Araneus ventricosus TaxID=182803 RepID=A0A4Y2KRN0_ARAVE|nr:hypothetical protein AVEN_20941-1 [Araneus ventricosus]
MYAKLIQAFLLPSRCRTKAACTRDQNVLTTTSASLITDLKGNFLFSFSAPKKKPSVSTYVSKFSPQQDIHSQIIPHWIGQKNTLALYLVVHLPNFILMWLKANPR